MKIKGKKIEGANTEIIPIPRGDGDDIILTAVAVLDYAPFEKRCPLPIPPKRKIDGVDVPQLKDKNYVKALQAHNSKRLSWMILVSLKATEGLEWESVKEDDPSTWPSVETELMEAGFSGVEVQRIIAGVYAANALNEAKIQAARERFFLSQQAPSED